MLQSIMEGTGFGERLGERVAEMAGSGAVESVVLEGGVDCPELDSGPEYFCIGSGTDAGLYATSWTCGRARGSASTLWATAAPGLWMPRAWPPPDPFCEVDCDDLCEECGIPPIAACEANVCLPVWW